MRIYFLLLISFLFSCHQNKIIRYSQSEQDSSSWERLIIVYTNDEHGWMESSSDDHSGAARLLNTWENMEGFGQSLILSGGDMWTGPALSTLTEGESMVHVMNTMGYDAAALGNRAVAARTSDASFPGQAIGIDGNSPAATLTPGI